MLVTLSYLYLSYYTITFVALFFVTYSFLCLSVVSSLSLGDYIHFLKKYSSYNFFFLILFFILTGIPPATLFLVKFSILSAVLYRFNFFISILICLIFLLNMFFYAQIYFFKNYLESNLKIIYNLSMKTHFRIIETNKGFNIIFIIFYFIIFSILNIFFYVDFLLLFYVHNKSTY